MCISGVFPAIYRVDLKFEARPEVAAAQQADPAQSDIVR